MNLLRTYERVRKYQIGRISRSLSLTIGRADDEYNRRKITAQKYRIKTNETLQQDYLKGQNPTKFSQNVSDKSYAESISKDWMNDPEPKASWPERKSEIFKDNDNLSKTSAKSVGGRSKNFSELASKLANSDDNFLNKLALSDWKDQNPRRDNRYRPGSYCSKI